MNFTSPVAVDKEETLFGFISYYVANTLRRIPVQFFNAHGARSAWLDGGPIPARISTAVTDDMEPVIIGNFSQVMSAYGEQAKTLFQHTRIWQECIDNGSGLLLLFQAMHTMNSQGCTASQAIDMTLLAGMEIRASEQAVVQEMAALFQSAAFHANSNAAIEVRPALALQSESLYSLA